MAAKNPPSEFPVLYTSRESTSEEGGAGKFDELVAELRRLARIHLSHERPGHTLQITALVNEAFIRLFGARVNEVPRWTDQQHFLAAASQAMRRILVDYARTRNAAKRQSGMMNQGLADPVEDCVSSDVLDVHFRLQELMVLAPRPAQLVELRFFGGLSIEEAAEILRISPRQADRDWTIARAWLRGRLRHVMKQD